jgi:hypothetical protein
MTKRAARGRENLLHASPARRNRDRRAAFVLAGCVVGLTGAASVVRWFGATEAAAASALVVGCSTIFAGFVALRLREGGMRPARALAWGGVLLIAAAAPVLDSVFPGRLVGEGTVSRKGDAIELPSGLHGSVRILASGALPEGSYVHFSLEAGPEVLGGDLRRGATWWRAGEERRHYHEDRSSVLVAGTLPPGVEQLTLGSLAGHPVKLMVRVFAPIVPTWIVTLMALSTGMAIAVLASRMPRAQLAVNVALVAVCSGVLAATVARPDAAVGAVLAGFAGGTLVGVPLGIMIGAVSRGLGRLRFWSQTKTD